MGPYVLDDMMSSTGGFAKMLCQNICASAGSRTRVDCLEGNHANRYTTDATIYIKGSMLCPFRGSLTPDSQSSSKCMGINIKMRFWPQSSFYSFTVQIQSLIYCNESCSCRVSPSQLVLNKFLVPCKRNIWWAIMHHWCNVSGDFSRAPFDQILNKYTQIALAQLFS